MGIIMGIAVGLLIISNIALFTVVDSNKDEIKLCRGNILELQEEVDFFKNEVNERLTQESSFNNNMLRDNNNAIYESTKKIRDLCYEFINEVNSKSEIQTEEFNKLRRVVIEYFEADTNSHTHMKETMVLIGGVLKMNTGKWKL